jgi:sulfur carrier protein
MQVNVNGEPRRLPDDATVAELLAALGRGGRRVAVERHGETVPRSRHADTRLADGDRIEVVVAVGGG